MSRERSLTLKILTAAVRDLAPAIDELNRRQRRRAARVEQYFVAIEHSLNGPAEELRPWPSENVLYRFHKQYFGEGWNVENSKGTLGYGIHMARCFTSRKGLAKRVFGGWRNTNVWETTWARLLVVDDGVPALFLDRKQYSGDIAGWRQILRDTGWPELQR
ncbi:hypothetical protein [Nonomuraea sp. NPDC050202]|jgi:hypothetical protein|uniref:hypothetical protein n=1 Tax=Nonomuraea sp. NPDC050202 TaxID=3155035 RepID=UPI0033DE63FE